MGVNFRYIDYKSKFYEEFENNKYFNSEKILFIFLDNRMKDIFVKKIGGKLFRENPMFLTFEEVKERIFVSDKMVLKEAKRILAFFKSIPEEIKNELGITNYFDIIDFANNFFAYYRELNLSCNEKFDNPHKWQEKYLEYFEKIKESFEILMEKYNYIPSDWLEDYKNFDPQWLKKFTTIIFVDIVEFPKLYRKIIFELGRDKKEEQDIIFLLQMEAQNFDEENLKIKKVTVPEIDEKERFKIYKFEDEIQEGLALIEMKREKVGNVYSPAVEKNDFHSIFPNDFAPCRRPVMEDTKLFNFLNIQLQVLLTREEKLGKKYLLDDFLRAFENKVFKDYYELLNEEFILLNNLQKEGYKYISKSLLESFSDDFFPWVLTSKIEKILYDLDEISTIKDVDTLFLYFKEVITLDKLLEEELDNKDILEKFVEIFGLLKINEKIVEELDNENIFGKRVGDGLYRLLIQYMKGIVVKSNIEYEKDITLIKPLDFIKYVETRDEVTNFFIDITDENLPKIAKDNLIFTEMQKKDLGIITQEEKREIEKYRFYQAVNYGSKTLFFTKKDEENNINISPFLEEIISKNGLKIEDIPVSMKRAEEVIETLFFGKGIGKIPDKNEGFQKKTSDFHENRINLGAYDLNLVRDCQLKFYFEKMQGLDYVIKAENKDLDPRILGIIVHKVLERIVKEMWKEVISSGVIRPDVSRITLLLKEEFESARDKIQIHMDNYIEQILIPILATNIENFFHLLDRKYMDKKIKRFQSERGNYEKEPYYCGKIDVYLTGRADLIIETATENTVIDYKTGSNSNGQLDYYSVILYGDENATNKAFFNVWKGEYKRIDKPQLTKSEIDEVVQEFSDATNYIQKEKIGSCKSCQYSKICRREE